MTIEPSARKWPGNDASRIPAWIYSDADIFKREIETFHRGETWNFVGLECEVPNAGDYKRSWLGTTPLLVVRDEKGDVQVLENRCAHRGTMVCWQNKGNAKNLTCPYHHWSYDLRGNLLGLPFLRGAMGKGGMPREFDKSEHGLKRLHVHVRGGLVWASFADNPPDFEAYMGEEILKLIDRSCPPNGRKLRLIGYNRQLLPCNWKVYFDNSRDPYHAGILHSFFVTFGLLRTDTPFRAVPTVGGRHGIMASTYSPKTRDTQNEVTKELTSLKSDLTLQDKELVSPVDEFGDSSMINLSVFPSMFLQQHGNCLAVRHVIPKTPNTTELSWTHYGYEDDDEAMRARRLKQANLVGPSGYVALEDSEVVAQLQSGVESAPNSMQIVMMSGYDSAPQQTMITETLIRGFYEHYREQMKL